MSFYQAFSLKFWSRLISVNNSLFPYFLGGIKNGWIFDLLLLKLEFLCKLFLIHQQNYYQNWIFISLRWINKGYNPMTDIFFKKLLLFHVSTNVTILFIFGGTTNHDYRLHTWRTQRSILYIFWLGYSLFY